MPVFGCPGRLQLLPETVYESLDFGRILVQRLGGSRQLLPAMMKVHPPVTPAGFSAEGLVIEHAVCPARRVVGPVNLRDGRRQLW